MVRQWAIKSTALQEHNIRWFQFTSHSNDTGRKRSETSLAYIATDRKHTTRSHTIINSMEQSHLWKPAAPDQAKKCPAVYIPLRLIPDFETCIRSENPVYSPAFLQSVVLLDLLPFFTSKSQQLYLTFKTSA